MLHAITKDRNCTMDSMADCKTYIFAALVNVRKNLNFTIKSQLISARGRFPVDKNRFTCFIIATLVCYREDKM
jgi:hypothetical protein